MPKGTFSVLLPVVPQQLAQSWHTTEAPEEGRPILRPLTGNTGPVKEGLGTNGRASTFPGGGPTPALDSKQWFPRPDLSSPPPLISTNPS